MSKEIDTMPNVCKIIFFDMERYLRSSDDRNEEGGARGASASRDARHAASWSLIAHIWSL